MNTLFARDRVIVMTYLVVYIHQYHKISPHEKTSGEICGLDVLKIICFSYVASVRQKTLLFRAFVSDFWSGWDVDSSLTWG